MNELAKKVSEKSSASHAAEEFSVEFKGTTVPVVSVVIKCGVIKGGGIDSASVIRGIDKKFAQAPGYFEGEIVIIDLSQVAKLEDGSTPVTSDDLRYIYSALRQRNVLPVAIVTDDGSVSSIEESAKALGLSILPAPVVSSSQPVAAHDEGAKRKKTPIAKGVDAAPTAPRKGAMVVDSSVRSGQRIYAIGQDLVLLSDVGAGAEVIADGSIHCYGALRGRVLAGASGDESARIYSTNFQAELVSVAGFYRIFEKDDAAIIGDAMRVSMKRNKAAGNEPTIVIEPLIKD